MSELEEFVKPQFYEVEIIFKNKNVKIINCVEDFLIDNRIRVFISVLGYRYEVPLINVNYVAYGPDRKQFLTPQKEQQENGKT